MNAYVIFYLLFIFVLGAVMGSFVGAMTWRMKTHKDWVKGRSECEHCHHQLAVVDLIPILSYVTLGGKCRYCRKSIGRTAILLELGGGAAFLISALLFPSGSTFFCQQVTESHMLPNRKACYSVLLQEYSLMPPASLYII